MIFPMSSEMHALESEIAMIQFFGRKDLGTGILRNRTDGGDRGTTGYKPTPEQNKAQSEKMKLRGCSHLHSPEVIAKRSATMKGKPFTRAHRNALSASSKKDAKKIARMRSLAESQRGVPKTWSPEHRAAHKVAASAATKRMNATHKGDPIWIARAQAMAEGNKRPVVCVETGERFPSVEEAAKSRNSHAPNISRAIRTGKTAKGVRWAYVDSRG